jgi:uncharacterized protein (DUF433 family)
LRHTTHMNLLERIAITPDVRSPNPCDVPEYLAGGTSETEIVEDFPSLTHDDLRAVQLFESRNQTANVLHDFQVFRQQC